jgi:hypothetical protein
MISALFQKRGHQVILAGIAMISALFLRRGHQASSPASR